MRKIVAVVGTAECSPETPVWRQAYQLGAQLVTGGFRVLTGGLGGVMEAALAGAKSAEAYREGDTVALLPSFNVSGANPYADIVIATGMDVYRNAMVANADAVIALGGGAGTLSELSYAWHLCRLTIAYTCFGGWAAALAGAREASCYREGDTIALLPSFNVSGANPYADIVIATGMDVYRNAMVANADAVIALGGGAGTLSELSYAWHLCRLTIAYTCFGGWAAALAGQVLDGRTRCTDEEDRIFGVSSTQEAITLLRERLSKYSLHPQQL